MLSATTARPTDRQSQMTTQIWKTATRRIVLLAAAVPLALASAPALAVPAHAATTWMAGAVNPGSARDKTQTFFYTNAYTESDAEQYAMANCRAKFPTGCKLAGSTTDCMAVALGSGSDYAVAYGPSVQAAQVLAGMEIHGQVNTAGGGRCSWD